MKIGPYTYCDYSTCHHRSRIPQRDGWFISEGRDGRPRAFCPPCYNHLAHKSATSHGGIAPRPWAPALPGMQGMDVGHG